MAGLLIPLPLPHCGGTADPLNHYLYNLKNQKKLNGGQAPLLQTNGNTSVYKIVPGRSSEYDFVNDLGNS
jgi:hypothetical protein